MDGSDVDKHNRRVHEEYIDVIYKAWDQDLLTYDGEFIQVPFPYNEGIRGWPVTDWTRKYGAPGEVDEEGVLAGHLGHPQAVPAAAPQGVPAVLGERVDDHPHRQARHRADDPGVQPARLPPPGADLQARRRRRRAGTSKLGRGDRGLPRRHVRRHRSRGGGDVRAHPVLRASTPTSPASGSGRRSASPRTPRSTRSSRTRRCRPAEWTLDRIRGVKYGLAGTVDQVKRDIESLAKIHGDDGELEWFGWFFDQGLLTLDEAKRQMELFAEHIMPDYR